MSTRHTPRGPNPPPADLHDLSALVFDDRNANKGTPRGRAALERSLKEYGAGRGVLVDRHGTIIAGNKTVEQAKALGFALKVVQTDGQQLVVVQRNDLDLERDPKAQALAIADNRIAQLDLDWDLEQLRRRLEEGVDLSIAFTEQEFAELFAQSSTGRTDENAVVEPGPTTLKRGDVLVLGRHRLLCGDATSKDDVALVLAGATPVLMVTDPPYGVNYEPAWRHRANPSQRTTVGRVLNDDRANWAAAWQWCPASIAYVWHAGLHAGVVAADLEAAGFKIRSQIIWNKGTFALSRGAYHWAHEPAWYAVRGRGHWLGDRRQSTVWGVPNLNPVGGTRTADDAATGHSTQKPVRLWEIPIQNHTTPGDVIYDPFCGSGTALIAAEKTSRVCVGIDLDPRYVHAAVSRWEAFTGQQAVRHSPSRAASRRPR